MTHIHWECLIHAYSSQQVLSLLCMRAFIRVLSLECRGHSHPSNWHWKQTGSSLRSAVRSVDTAHLHWIQFQTTNFREACGLFFSMPTLPFFFLWSVSSDFQFCVAPACVCVCVPMWVCMRITFYSQTLKHLALNLMFNLQFSLSLHSQIT